MRKNPSFYSLIEEELAALEEYLAKMADTPLDLLSSLGGHLIKAGGKRLRPALFFLSAKSGNPEKDLISLSAALELIHMASLVHDDVIDMAAKRRGQPTANYHLGNRAAILAGDYFFAQAFCCLAADRYPKKINLKLAHLVQLLAMGEIIQDSRLYKIPADSAAYCRQIEKKTAAFFAVAAEIGAIAGGAAKWAADFSEYGRQLGLAFQITDDILDITGTEETLGKNPGSDIRQGVVTFPVLMALETSDAKQRLKSIVTDSAMSDDALAEAISIVRKSGAIESSRAAAQKYAAAAKRAIPAEVAESLREALGDLADYVCRREN